MALDLGQRPRTGFEGLGFGVESSDLEISA